MLTLKLYNLAHFILALWPLRLLRAFLEKWCVSIKSVCYFNSALLWQFEVYTVEINYQSQSRQSHGSCYRLTNWTVKNIHCLHFMLIRIQEKFELTVIFTWTVGYAWQLEKLHWMTLLTSFPTYLNFDLLVNCLLMLHTVQENERKNWFFSKMHSFSTMSIRQCAWVVQRGVIMKGAITLKPPVIFHIIQVWC